MRKPKKIIQWRFAFFLILLIAVNTRFIGLDTISLSLDELTRIEASHPTFKELWSTFSFATSWNSPFFNILLHIWATLFGESELALRSLPAMISFVSIFPFFGIARIFFNKRIAYTAAALYALSPLAVTLAQTISPLPLFMMFSLMSTWAMLMMMRRHQLEYRIFYIATIFGALFTHPAFWFLFTFHHLSMIGSFFHKSSRHLTLKGWIFLEAILIGGLFLAYPEKLPELHLPFSRGMATPLIAFAEFIFVQSGSYLLFLLFLIILFQLIFNSRRYHIVFHQFTPRIIYLIFWGSILTLMPFLFSFNPGEYGRANSAVAGIFPFLLLIASGIDTIDVKKRRKWITIAALLLSVAALQNRFSEPITAPWKSITANLSTEDPQAGIILDDKNIPRLTYYGTSAQLSRYTSVSESDFDDTLWQSRVDEIADTSLSLFLLLEDFEKESNFLLTYLSDEFSTIKDTTHSTRGTFNRNIPTLRVISLRRKE